MQVDPRRLPPGFSISDLPLDLNVIRGLAARVSEQLPILGELLQGEGHLRQHRGGLPTMTSDGRHIVGPLPGVHGMWVATGCCVGGLTISPSIGAALAGWIVSGESQDDLSQLSPGRFGAEVASEAALAEAARVKYARHYSAH